MVKTARTASSTPEAASSAKRKIWKVLNRDQGFTLSISTVGRLLKKLLRLNRIVPVAFYFGRIKPKRRRQFKHHAKRWKYGMKARQPGELMQVDHMSVSFTEGFALKEFKATCPVTGTTIMRTYSSASSRNARRFLDYLIAQLPDAPWSLFRWMAAVSSGMSLSRPVTC